MGPRQHADERPGRAPNGDGQDDARHLPVTELVKRLSEETAALVRQELQLARAEMAGKGKTAGVGAGMVGGAGLMGLGAFGAFTAACVLGLAKVVPAWLAALVVAGVYGAAAAAMGLTGKKRLREAASPIPEQTIETVKQDVGYLKDRVGQGDR